MRRYYAADNYYSTDVSIGFSNTWYVLVFDSRSARDQWVRTSPHFAARAIKRDEVTKYASNWDMRRNEMSAPRPFNGERWAIFPQDPDREIPGCIGHVDIAYPDEYHGSSIPLAP